MATSGVFYGSVTCTVSVTGTPPPRYWPPDPNGVVNQISVDGYEIDANLNTPQGNVFSGVQSGTSISVSASGCGAFSGSGSAAARYADGFLYTVAVHVSVTGNPNPGQYNVTIDPVDASTSFPTVFSGTYGATGSITPNITLHDNTAGHDISAPTTISNGKWSIPNAAGLLTHGHTYVITAVIPGDDCNDGKTRTLTFTVPTTFPRGSDFNVVSSIGPAVISSFDIVSEIGRTITTEFAIATQIDSPLASPPDPNLIYAALAPIHNFQVQLFVMWDGINWVEETIRLVGDIGGIDDVDLTEREFNTSEVTIVLDNGDDRFTFTNVQSPIAANLRQTGQKIWLLAGYNGYVDTVFIGKVDSITPTSTDKTVTIHGLDVTADWRQLTAYYPPTGDPTQRTSDIMRTLLESVGLTDGVDFTLDDGDVTIPYAIAPGVPLMPELQYLAQVEGGRLFIDKNGLLNFWSRTHTLQVQSFPVVALDTYNHLYDLTRSTSPAGFATSIIWEWQIRDASGPSTIFTLTNPLLIPAMTSIGPDPNNAGANLYAPGVVTVLAQPQDPLTFERYVPAMFTGLTGLQANTKRDGSGGTIPTIEGTVTTPVSSVELSPGPPIVYGPPTDPQLHWEVDLTQVGRATITFWNLSFDDIFVTGLTLQGEPQTGVAPLSIVVTDPEADQSKLVELQITNPYPPEASIAQDRAREALALRKDPLAQLQIPLQDGLPFLRPFDVIRVTDTSVANVTVVLDAQVLHNEWTIGSQGYTQSLVLVPALTSQYRGLIASVVLSATPTATTATPSNDVYGTGLWGTAHWS